MESSGDLGEVQQKLSNAVENHLSEVEVSTFRPLQVGSFSSERISTFCSQKRAYLCSAKCCDSTGSRESVERCVESCSTAVSQAQQHLNAQLQNFAVSGIPVSPS